MSIFNPIDTDPLGGGGTGPGGGTGGGGSNGGGESYSDAVVPETATLVMLLSEGRVEGPVNGLKSVYLDGTPVLSDTGAKNFKGIAAAVVAGTNTQGYIKGISSVESETAVGVQVTNATPVVRTISSNPSAVRVRIAIPAFKVVNSATGAASGHSVNIRIERQNASYNGGAWEIVSLFDSGTISGGPFSTKFTKAYRIDLPATGSWQIRVSRLSADDADAYHLSQTWWDAYTEVVDAKLRRPNRAALAIRLNGKQFRSTPQINIHMRGVRIQVPQNYTPAYYDWAGKSISAAIAVNSVAKTFTRASGDFTADGVTIGRAFDASGFSNSGNNGKFIVSNVTALVITCATATGLVTEGSATRTLTTKTWTPAVYATTGLGTTGGAWDGSFKTVWSSNPAWVFYDACTNVRYGAGSFINSYGTVDKWTLYNIAQWCDVMVADGIGGLEPRMTCNLYLQGGQNAIKALSYLASIFAGVLFYSSGVVSPIADVDEAPSEIFTNANVEDGRFTYHGTARSARHTACIVSFINPALGFASDTAIYEDEDGIARYGYRVLDYQAIGCTSPGQALRTAKTAVLTELLCSEVTTFTSGLKASTLAPGRVIEVADQFRAGNVRSGGVVVAGSTTTSIVLDAPVTLGAGTYTLRVQTITGLESKTVTNSAGTYSTLALSSALSSTPTVGTGWLLQAGTTASLWRVVSITKGEGLKYDVAALKHDPQKYVLLGLATGDVVPKTRPVNTTPTPTGLSVSSISRILNDRQQVTLLADWVLDGALGYYAEASRDYGPWELMTVSGASAYLDGIQPGVWRVRVAGDWRTAGLSPFVVAQTTVAPSATVPPWINNGVLLNDPDTIAIGEKPQVIQEYNVLVGENSDLVAKANTYGVSHATYDTAYTALITTYLGGTISNTPVAWNSLLGATSLGAGKRVSEWNPKWLALRSAANDLKAAIASGAFAAGNAAAAQAALANSAAVLLASDVPTTVATLPGLPNASYPVGKLVYSVYDGARFRSTGTAWEIVTLVPTDNLIPNPNSDVIATSGPESKNLFNIGTSGTPMSASGRVRKLSCPGGYTGFEITDRIPVSVGESYYLEGYAYKDSAWTGDPRISVVFDREGGDWYWDLSTNQVTSTDAYNPTKLSLSFDITASFHGHMPKRIWVICRTDSGVGNAYFNRFTLKRKATQDLIVDGAIRANHLAVDSVTASAIQAGAVGADEIAANVIYSKKLIIANFDNLIPNPNSEADVSGLPTNAPEKVGVVPYGARTGTHSREVGGLTGGYPAIEVTSRIPCAPGDKFFFEGYGFRTTAGNGGSAMAYIIFHDSAGNYLPGGTAGVPAMTTGYQKYNVSATAPTNAAYVTMIFENDLVPTGTNAYWDDLYFRKMMAGEVLVDGTVTADKMVTDLALVNTIRSNNYDGNSSTQSTVGFKIQGTAFNAKDAAGATQSVQADFASNMLIGGYRAAVITNRVIGNSQVWSTAQTTTWTCPEGITSVELLMVGAGGGGQGSITNTSGGIGGSGGVAVKKRITVTPGVTYTLVVGTGGTAGTAGGGHGANGGSSSMSGSGFSTITIAGGPGSGSSGSGANGPYSVSFDTGSSAIGGSGGSGGNIGIGQPPAISGGTCWDFNGGLTGNTSNSSGPGGGGGASVLAAGGNGKTGAVAGDAGTLGSGGGGGGCSTTANAGGGRGGDGYIRISW